MAVNKFLEFNEQKNEMQTDEQYSADTQRIGGLQTGLARTVLHNKLFRQASVMVSALGKVVADLGKNADDTSRDTLAQNIKDTMLSAENHALSAGTAELYGVENVDAALKRAIIDYSSYQAFCANVNTNSLDAAFGKNNEGKLVSIGEQLAMYSWFKGDSKVSYPYTNLCTKNKLTDIFMDSAALLEVIKNLSLQQLIVASPYAKTIWDAQTSTDAVVIALMSRILNMNLSAYTTITALVASTSFIDAFVTSDVAILASVMMGDGLASKLNTAYFKTKYATFLATLNASSLFTKTSVNKVGNFSITKKNIYSAYAGHSVNSTAAETMYYRTANEILIATPVNVATSTIAGISLKGVKQTSVYSSNASIDYYVYNPWGIEIDA